MASIASAGALAIAGAVGMPLLGGQTTAPSASAAFALETNDDGTITVTLYDFADADGLEEQLAEHGVTADVTYVPWGMRCQAGRYEPSPYEHEIRVRWDSSEGTDPNDMPVSFTVRPTEFHADETLVVINDQMSVEPPGTPGGAVDGQVYVLQPVSAEVAIGEVEPCVLEDDPSDHFELPPGAEG